MVRSASLLAPVLGLFSAAGASALPAASSAERDSNPGCTASSFKDFDWTLTDFVYNASYVFSTPAHQIDGGIVQFNLTNPALTYPAACYAYSSQLEDFFYGNIIYNCTVPEEDAASTETTFTFSYPAQEVNVNQTWTCSDQDPTYPDTFVYAGSVNLTLDCSESDYQNPNWTIGEIYSSKLISCMSPDVTIIPYLVEAEA